MTLEELHRFFREEFPQAASRVEALGRRTARVRQQIDVAQLRPGGTVSGPVLMALADEGLYAAILGEIGRVPLAVTTNLTVNFLRRPSAERDVVGECRLLKVGRRLIVGEVLLYSEGEPEPIAHAIGTYSVPPRR